MDEDKVTLMVNAAATFPYFMNMQFAGEEMQQLTSFAQGKRAAISFESRSGIDALYLFSRKTPCSFFVQLLRSQPTDNKYC